MSVVKTLCDGGLGLTISKVDAGYSVAIYDVRDADLPADPDPAGVRDAGREVYATVKSGLFESEQRNREFVNSAKEQLPGDQRDKFVQEFQSFAREVAESGEKQREVQRTETVARLLRETQGVTVHPGEETHWRVEFSRDGRTERIEFTSGEWTADSPAPLRERYAGVYYENLDLDADEWRTLRDEWAEQQQVMDAEQITSATMKAETVKDELKRTLNVYDSVEGIENNTGRVAWWKPAEDTELVDDGDGVVLVPSHVIRSAMRDAGFDVSDAGELSREFRDNGVMVDTTVRRRIGGDRQSLWPLRPVNLRIDPEFDVFRVDAE